MQDETTTMTEITTVEQDGVQINAATPEIHVPVEVPVETTTEETRTETTTVEKE